MAHYKIKIDGNIQDEVFDSYIRALLAVEYWRKCSKLGKEIIHMIYPENFSDDYGYEKFEIIGIE